MKTISSVRRVSALVSLITLAPFFTQCGYNHGKAKLVSTNASVLPEAAPKETPTALVTDETPQAPETTVPNKSPVLENTPVQENSPVQENTPVQEEAPAPVETPAPVVIEEAPAPQIARFMVWIEAIEKDLFLVSPADVPDRLYKNKAREKVFNIQALGRIYKDLDPALEEMHNRFKDLEDAIGDYQKWADYEEEGIRKGESRAILAKLARNREAGRQHLVDALRRSQFLVTREGELPYTVKLRKFLKSYAWPDAKADRIYVLKKLIKELEKTKTATYDFSHLEDGNGVHEFRRKMRWFAMEARGLDGLITLKPRSTECPVASWANLINNSIANTKYAVLPANQNEPNPISLTPCLYIKNARMVEDVNVFKAKVEAAETFSQEVATDLMDPADQLILEGMYQDVIDNDLFGLLQAELQAGLDAELAK